MHQNTKIDPSSNKTNKLHYDIRRKFIDDLYRKERESLNKTQSIQNQPQQIPTHQQIIGYINNKNIQNLYKCLSKCDNLPSVVSNQTWEPIIRLAISQQFVNKYQSIQLLNLIVLHCCSKFQEDIQKRYSVVSILQKYNVCQQIYQLTCTSINHKDIKLTNLYLFFLKNCALTRISAIRSKHLIQQYLPILQKQILGESSVLILMTYIGQQYVFAPNIIAEVCNKGLVKESRSKIIVANIILNYIALQDNYENIRLLFDHLFGTLQHLYMNCYKLNSSLGGHILHCMSNIIAKYPQNCEKQLLQRIKNNKLQDLLLLLLSVASESVKFKVYLIQQSIIDKCLEGLRQQIFNHLHPELIDKIILGLQYTDYEIISKCLKILIKLCHYASQTILDTMNKNQLDYILTNLTYHKDSYISQSAQILVKYFQAKDQQDIEIQF